MPIKNPSLYPKNWKEISLAIRTKANWKCEFCNIPNSTIRISKKGKPYKVVLTVAHLGESQKNKMDCSNLAALCQVCHLNYDKYEHTENAKETRRKKKEKTQPTLDGIEKQ